MHHCGGGGGGGGGGGAPPPPPRPPPPPPPAPPKPPPPPPHPPGKTTGSIPPLHFFFPFSRPTLLSCVRPHPPNGQGRARKNACSLSFTSAMKPTAPRTLREFFGRAPPGRTATGSFQLRFYSQIFPPIPVRDFTIGSAPRESGTSVGKILCFKTKLTSQLLKRLQKLNSISNFFVTVWWLIEFELFFDPIYDFRIQPFQRLRKFMTSLRDPSPVVFFFSVSLATFPWCFDCLQILFGDSLLLG